MASIKKSANSRGSGARYIVHYRDEQRGHGRRRTFINLDEAAEFFWKVEESALRWRTAEIAEIRNAWTLQKLIWFYLGMQHNKLNRNVIKLSSYTKCRADLLAIPSEILKKNIMRISTRELSAALRPGAQKWIRSAFCQLQEKEVITFNPQERQKARKRKPITIPTKAAVKALLNDSPRRERIACWLAARCGLRIGEVLALTYADLSRDWIQINKHITPEGSQAGLKTGTERRVKMPRELFSLLETDNIGSSLPVIANSRTGAPLGLGYSNQGVLRTTLNSHGVKRFHDLRHFAVSRLADRGVDILKVSRMIGHSSITTTMNIYGHLFGETIDLDFD